MAMTPYSGDTSVIGKLGTTPQERGLTTQQFKDKFDEGLKTFVEWFNETHNGEINEHMAENATEAHDGISILNITVTVGNNGDFSTINDALNYLTTKYPAYKSGGNVKATIKLLSGFAMSEQVLVRGLNLGIGDCRGRCKTTIG